MTYRRGLLPFVAVVLAALPSQARPAEPASDSPTPAQVTLPVPLSESFLLSMPQVSFVGPFALDWQVTPNLWLGVQAGVSSTTDPLMGSLVSATTTVLIGPRLGYAIGLGPVTLVPRLALDALLGNVGTGMALELALPAYVRLGSVLVGPSLQYLQPLNNTGRSSVSLVLTAGVLF